MTNHTATAAQTVVRLSGPQGLVAAAPVYLGFHPSDSLVLLCLRAPRGRVGPVVRTDLFPPDAVEPLEQLLGCARRYADSAAILCYHDGPRPACLDVLLQALHRASVPVTAVLSVRDGRIRDATSARTERSDRGIPVSGPGAGPAQELATACALAGRQILPTRDAQRASIASPTGARLADARAAISEACRRFEADLTIEPGRLIGAELPERMDAAIAAAVAEYSGSGAVTMATAAELIVLAGDVTSRDRLIGRVVGREDPEVVPLLISAVGWCPDEDAAEICAVLAVAAYRFGDGALAQCALDRVFSVAPTHRLAHLMASVMAAGLPPRELASMAEMAPDLDGDGRRSDGRRCDGRRTRRRARKR